MSLYSGGFAYKKQNMSIVGVLRKQKWFWLSGVGGIIIIRLAATNQDAIEKFYSENFYYYFSIVLRFLFGWLPFSIGDIVYFIAGLWLLWKTIKNIKIVFSKQLTRDKFIHKTGKLLMMLIMLYLVFNIFWGLNYNRNEIASQLQLPKIKIDTANVLQLQQLLLQKVNETKVQLIKDKIIYPDNKVMFQRAEKCYDEAAKIYPMLTYHGSSVKSSLYGWLGNYLGFTGYYNPFTGEAQVNTTVPRFLIPYITLHEIGHQVGYAKENEANFCGYLAAANAKDTLFQYSAYLDLFVYANREVYYFDSTASKLAASQLSAEVKADILEWRNFNRKHRSVFEPAINWLYGKYLQVNAQPKGLQSYDDVIAALIAYYKKTGKL